MLSVYGVTARTDADRVIIDDIELSVSPGELVALVGPSGAGKTTLLRCISGLHVPAEGRIVVAEQDITNMPVVSRPVAFMQQGFVLYDQLTILQNVLVAHRGRQGQHPKTEEAINMMRQLGITENLHQRRPETLSGGEAQRVAICKALLRDSKVLLMDEPFSSLDKRRRREIGWFLRQRAKAHGTRVVLVSHDEIEMSFLVDRICIMREGRIVQTGTINELHSKPTREQVASFGIETGLQVVKLAKLSPHLRAKVIGLKPSLSDDKYLAWRPDHSVLRDSTPPPAQLEAHLLEFEARFIRSIPATGGDFLELHFPGVSDASIWHFQAKYHRAMELSADRLFLHINWDDVVILDESGRVCS